MAHAHGPFPRYLSAVAGAWFTVAWCSAAHVPPQAQPPAPGAAGPREVSPALRLGIRVATVRTRIPHDSRVVVVPEGRSFIEAVGAWSLEARYPVLIDDGSWLSREAIARFVRAYSPAQVVRWSAPEQALPLGNDADRRARIEAAAARAWGAPSPAQLGARLKELGFAPPGVVVAWSEDPAWTAALALAAGHGQPIVWHDLRGDGAGVNGWLLEPQMAAHLSALEAAMSALPWSWDALGDDIDSVTICQNMPGKTHAGPVPATVRTALATTDVIGRPRAAFGASERDPAAAARWAWAGQVFGTESHAAYMAMCSLFLSPARAWLFDGYDSSAPWNEWDATAAAVHLERAGVQAMLDDEGRRGIDDWRRRAAGLVVNDPRVPRDEDAPPGLLAHRRGIDAGLIFVNTSGNQDFFDLKPGQGKPVDVPVLRVPAAVHFVHSWSATAPADRNTVGGRWIERGAFAYLGSTYEPYLQAFVPTPLAAQRMLAAYPFGAAVRLDRAAPWKLTVIGDPLYICIPAKERADRPLPGALRGASSISEEFADHVKAGRFTDALECLRLLGRDRDAARLLAAIIKDRPDALTPDVALAGLSAAFFELEPAMFDRVYHAASVRIDADPDLAAGRDLRWHAAEVGR